MLFICTHDSFIEIRALLLLKCLFVEAFLASEEGLVQEGCSMHCNTDCKQIPTWAVSWVGKRVFQRHGGKSIWPMLCLNSELVSSSDAMSPGSIMSHLS